VLSVDAGPRQRPRLGPAFWVSVAWVALVALVALLADVLPLGSVSHSVGRRGAAPTAGHLFGLDALGRDLLSRTIHGARVSLAVGFTAVAVSLVIGGVLGLLAGYYRGRVERVIMSGIDVLLAFPALVLALAIVTFLGSGKMSNVILAISVLSIGPFARLIRASTLTYAQRDFVLAARAMGARDRAVIVREILPNVAVPAAAYALIGVALAILAEGALAFLGLSVAAPTPTWGGMINDGRTILDHSPQVTFIPALVMFATVLALNLVGDRLQSVLEVRESGLA
jgi:peptide/nickel transport system permease protein